MADTIAATPLTPESISAFDENVVKGLPSLPGGYSPEGTWTQKYHIMTCHGYTNRSNTIRGYISLERKTSTTAGSFDLSIHYETECDKSILNTIEAEVECTLNDIASPKQWTLTSQFTKGGANIGRDCSTDAQVSVNGDQLDILKNGVTSSGEGSLQLAADWCIFEAVQRLAFSKDVSLAFDQLDGLSVLKKNQKLTYLGEETQKINGSNMQLHCFVQIGEGVLPYEYWLDADHRLCFVTTGDRAYILST
jgi:hypothetical protein